LTGANATQADALVGAKARIALENDKGGVNGHKLEILAGDDASSPDQALTAAKQVISQGAMILQSAGYYAGSLAAYAKTANVPVIGTPIGTVWGTQPNTNLVATLGSPDPKLPPYTTVATLFKQKGATKFACISNNSAGGKATCKGHALAVKQLGLTPVFEDSSVPFTQTDFTNVALSVKNSGADGVLGSFSQIQNIQLMEALYNAGVKPRVEAFSTGYSQTILDNATDRRAGEDVYFAAFWAPVEAQTDATKAFAAALKKYAGRAGVPSYDTYSGWVGASLVIRALREAGADISGPNILTSIQKVSDWNAEGLGASPVDLSLSKFGTYAYISTGANGCLFFVQMKGTGFVPVNGKGEAAGSAPVCGQPVTGS
jgi:branched-chain amino acid transport system substrate-binding protein